MNKSILIKVNKLKREYKSLCKGIKVPITFTFTTNIKIYWDEEDLLTVDKLDQEVIPWKEIDNQQEEQIKEKREQFQLRINKLISNSDIIADELSIDRITFWDKYMLGN